MNFVRVFRISSFNFLAPWRTSIRGYRGPSTPSILPEGTPIKGINIFKDGKDPVALKDEDYPEWLWTCDAPPKKEFTKEEENTKRYAKFVRKQKIKDHNFKKSQW
ncbi:hypothetical protein HMI54_006326 [Coelomomyces lativittatus]|nr:hypothetical protein HMI54_006326 [Coelomomyces lativittatus]KAJ1511537.1 hypothetical protein HMI56_005260 [Coelomomyces lativittatus]KAJ1516205.1 hypothetical protein HMI55_002778 [Coelomomyces lativittatus]